MKKEQLLLIAVLGSLAPSFANMGASYAAATRPTTTVSKAKKTTTTARSASTGTASLIVTGFVSDTLTEVRLTTPRCHPAGAVTNAGFEFDGPKSRYVLSFLLPTETTTFPSTNRQAYIGLVDLGDASKHWVIGDRKLAPTAGTATFDGAQGTIDVDMSPDPPNSALTHVHVKGSFTCAYGP